MMKWGQIGHNQWTRKKSVKQDVRGGGAMPRLVKYLEETFCEVSIVGAIILEG